MTRPTPPKLHCASSESDHASSPKPCAAPTGKRIALLGGSFNPPHYGHVGLGDYIIEQCLADEVWYMVTPHNPLKKQSDLLPEDQRLRLVEQAIQGHPRLHACDFEFALPRPSYTMQTLDALRVAYPAHTFLLLIGADNWARFAKWRDHQRILAEYEILVYPRTGTTIDPASLPPNVRLLNAPIHPISSTELRQAAEK